MKAPFVRRYKCQGFTLIEMVIVISILGMVGVLVSMMAGRQMEAYVAASRRAALVSLAGAAISHLERDIHAALPNSVRVSGTQLELVPVRQVLRYRDANSSLAGSDILDVSIADTQFQLLGTITSLPTGARAVVYNTGLTSGSTPIAGVNAYAAASVGPFPPAAAHVITPTSTSLSLTHDSSGDFITLTPGHQFAFASPQKRMYLVTGALSYRCDLTTQTLTRYRDYPLQSSQPITHAQFVTAGATSAVAATKITSCSFTYQAGNPQQSALVTVYLKLEDAGEAIELLHQIHVDNAI